jgi:hypothetical protein
MNITNRIKKIEEKVSVNNPEPGFCPCYKKHFESLGESVYNKDPNVKIEVYPCPDLNKPLCNFCGKPFAPSVIVFTTNLVKQYEGRQAINEHIKQTYED